MPGNSYPEDAVGHGTFTAALLLRVARNANVYIARVTPDGSTWDSNKVAKVSKVYAELLPLLISTVGNRMGRRRV